MAEDVLVRTAGVFQGISQDGEPVVVQMTGGEVAVVVEGLGEGGDSAAVPGEPGGIERDGTEGIAEDAANHSGKGILRFLGTCLTDGISFAPHHEVDHVLDAVPVIPAVTAAR
jgi:hypothetical protein